MYEKFEKDLIQAMKNQDKTRLAVLRMVKGAMQLEHIDKKRELNEELLIDVVGKQIKMRNESIEQFKAGNRQDLVDSYSNEIEILKEYLPKQLSLEEVNAILDDVFNKVNPTSAKDMGSIMREATPLLKGKADMKNVSELIKDRLSKL